jgi:hypothetical protein
MKSDTKALIIFFATVSIAAVCFLMGYLQNHREPTYFGRQIAELLNNSEAGSTNLIPLNQMLTLKYVVTDDEPNMATFQVPISYDTIKTIGYVSLLVDPTPDGSYSSGKGEFQQCDRATNGNCLLVWNTAYDLIGTHRLKVQLYIQGQRSKRDFQQFYSPTISFYFDKLCQFSNDKFDARGATLLAKVYETNTVYRIDVKTSSGQILKTFAGKSKNYKIEEFWDLTADNGQSTENLTELDAVFYITNSASGSNVLKLTRSH